MRRFAILLVALGLVVLSWAAAPPSPRPSSDLFRQSVWPVLQAKCLGCHGDDPKKLRGGLDLRTRAGALKGGDSGQPAIVPGHPEKSPLYRAVTRTDDTLVMPPKESDRLDAGQIALLRRWLLAGADWPALSKKIDKPEVKRGIQIATSGGRSPEWTHRVYQADDVWAYQPINRPPVPEGEDHPIDAFLKRKQREKGIDQTAPAADRRTLLRRLSFNLIGLPPTPEEIDSFVADASTNAYARVVTRLLASSHYGERWAQHWLDVARYADTAGFANDYERTHAWRYRDWVVRALNADKPYDQFLREQIAGDELDPDNPQMRIAVGFLRMGPWEHTGMSVAAVTRQQYLDDVTHSVGVTVLAQGLRCASCHDHKFDPVPTRDYYRFQAIFAPTQFAEPATPFLPSENTKGFAQSKVLVERRLKKADEEVSRLRKKIDDAMAAYLVKRGVKRIIDLPESDRPKRDRFGLSKPELSQFRILMKRAEYFRRELLRYEPYALSVYNGPDRAYLSPRAINSLPPRRSGPIPVVRILPGGSLETPAEVVTPGILSAVVGSNDAERRTAWNSIPSTMHGRRLALANWLASAQNPLVPRVIVNRVWQHHFGKGLVATSGNFGKMGGRPTHPELLDWLAVWFVEHGWSLKKLHRLIVSSKAYQLSGQHPDRDALDRVDPKNEMLAYFPTRRLSAEEMRDAMLTISGELNREIGGPGVFPEINWEVALQPRHIMGSVAPAYVPSPMPAQRNRRTIYAFRYRTLPDPLLEVFNRPGSESACDCRDQTTVTSQALTLFNSAFTHNRALAFASMLTKKSDNVDDQINLAFRHCHGRSATARELARCREHVQRMIKHHEAHAPRPVELPTLVKRRMVEEMTGEEFEWEEELDLEGYQRDLQPWDVKAATRALADLCLVLFNSNEFLHVR